MLINSDFERHGFEIHKEVSRVQKWYTKHPECKFDLMVIKLRKGVHMVKLVSDGKYIDSEAMYHPDRLREFLLFHKVITHNEK